MTLERAEAAQDRGAEEQSEKMSCKESYGREKQTGSRQVAGADRQLVPHD